MGLCFDEFHHEQQSSEREGQWQLKQIQTSGMKKTLGLTGSPSMRWRSSPRGRFLWITFQIQAANTGGRRTCGPGIVARAHRCISERPIGLFRDGAPLPEAGAGGSYYFAEKAFLDRIKLRTRDSPGLPNSSRAGRRSLILLGLSRRDGGVHATLVTYILGIFGIDLSILYQIGIAILVFHHCRVYRCGGVSADRQTWRSPSMSYRLVVAQWGSASSLSCSGFRIRSMRRSGRILPPSPSRSRTAGGDVVPVHDRHTDTRRFESSTIACGRGD